MCVDAVAGIKLQYERKYGFSEDMQEQYNYMHYLMKNYQVCKLTNWLQNEICLNSVVLPKLQNLEIKNLKQNE